MPLLMFRTSPSSFFIPFRFKCRPHIRSILVSSLVLDPRWEVLMDLLYLFVVQGPCHWFFPPCKHALSLNRFLQFSKSSTEVELVLVDQSSSWESFWGDNFSSGTYARCPSAMDFQDLTPGLLCISVTDQCAVASAGLWMMDCLARIRYRWTSLSYLHSGATPESRTGKTPTVLY